MRPRSLFAPALVASFAAIFAPACGSDTGSGAGGADSGDGKYRPAGNGQHQAEADACKALGDAQSARGQALSCTTTSRPCPSLIQVMVGGTTCLEYDQGSVQGCVAYYDQQATCEALAQAVDACLVIAFEGSAPAGCP